MAKPPFKYLYFVLPTPAINEVIASFDPTISGTETRLVNRRPVGYDYDIQVWEVTSTELDSLVTLQKNTTDVLFVSFIQRTQDGKLKPYTRKAKKICIPIPKIRNIVDFDFVQQASMMATVYYITGKEGYNSILKKHAVGHMLKSNRLMLEKGSHLKRLVFYTSNKALMIACLEDTKLDPLVKKDIVRYVSVNGKPLVLCDEHFVPLTIENPKA